MPRTPGAWVSLIQRCRPRSPRGLGEARSLERRDLCPENWPELGSTSAGRGLEVPRPKPSSYTAGSAGSRFPTFSSTLPGAERLSDPGGRAGGWLGCCTSSGKEGARPPDFLWRGSSTGRASEIYRLAQRSVRHPPDVHNTLHSGHRWALGTADRAHQLNVRSRDGAAGPPGPGAEGAVIYLDFRAAVGAASRDILVLLPRQHSLFQRLLGVDKQPAAPRPRPCPHVNCPWTRADPGRSSHTDDVDRSARRHACTHTWVGTNACHGPHGRTRTRGRAGLLRTSGSRGASTRA